MSYSASNPQSSDILIAFLDANIVLEGKPIADLPWYDLASDGTIRVMIVPKAMEEIDAKKRDGRLAETARSFNRLMAKTISNNGPVVIREADPRVEISLAVCGRVPWEQYEDLDPADGDSCIVAQALNTRGVDPYPRMLVSHDMKPLAFANNHGLPVHVASDSWLRPVEPSPKDKEIQRLRQQVADFKKNEPLLEIAIGVEDVAPLSVLRIAHLTSSEAHSLTESIRSTNGPLQSSRTAGPYGLSIPSFDRDSSYSGRYDRYIDQTVPAFVEQFHVRMEMLYNQRLLSIRVSNTGR